MPNTSATGGYLTPDPIPAPLQGDPLLDFIQEWVVGLTGLAPELVRPRWQPEPANIPKENVTWVAIGITKRPSDTFAAELHIGAGSGYNEVRRHEELHLLASVYGPNADEVASTLREGMQVAQNREILQLNSMGLIGCDDISTVPELLKEKWMYRLDLPFQIRRQIVRRYGVQNLLSGKVDLNNEKYTETIIIEE